MAVGGIDGSPAMGRLYWTSFAELEGDSGPADPLRFDMYIQRLGNILLPGVTNRTERVRYLSMVCAGLLQAERVGATVRERRQAFLPFERGWALAMTLAADGRLKRTGEQDGGGRGLRHEFRGLRGANRVLRHWRTLKDVDAIQPANYVLLQGQDAQGGLGAYLVTLREFGFVHPDTLTVTASGRELAEAFAPKGKRGIRLSMLADERRVSRHHLHRLGEELMLGRLSHEERQIVWSALFDHPRSILGEVVGRIDAARPDAQAPRERLLAIADPGGDELARAAAFAIVFDPLRVAALSLFAGLGTALVPLADTTHIAKLATGQMERDATALRRTAAALAPLPIPRGLEPIGALAESCADAASFAETVESLIAYHRREGRSWIVAEGKDRYRVARHGSFDRPAEEFNGYTLGRAYDLRDDLRIAA